MRWLLFCLFLLCARSATANVGRGIPLTKDEEHSLLQRRLGHNYETITVVRRDRTESSFKRPTRKYLARSVHQNIKRAFPTVLKDASSRHLFVRDGHGTTEESAAQLNDPTDECTPYYIPAINAISNQFPTVWEVADIMKGDNEAMTIMQTINASGVIPPGIGVRGTQPQSLSGAGLDAGYDSNSDPACWWTDTQCVQPKAKGILPDITACNEPYTWGYTFDDGPNGTHNALYDMWAQNNQKTSLMYIGSNVIDWPLEAQRGIVDGHHICVHTWSHRYMTALTTNQAFAELYYALKAIKYVMGVTPTCWRPPYGDVDDRIRGIAQSLGLRTIMWNEDSNDWNVEPYGTIPTASLRETYSSFIALATQPAAATGGIIVLEHELEDAAMNMSIEQYPAIKKAWKNVVPLTACLNITNPYPENIVYPDFAEYTSGDVTAKGLPDGQMPIATSANVIPQGTLSGMGSSFPTASNGAGNSISSITTTATADNTAAAGQRQNANSVNAKSSATKNVLASPLYVQAILAGITLGFCAVFL